MLLPECTREAAQQQVPRWLQAASSPGRQRTGGLCPLSVASQPSLQDGGRSEQSGTQSISHAFFFPFPPSCRTLGIKAAFVKYRQMTPRCCTGLRPAQQWREHHHHQQRKLLMRNAQDIHGRGNHSKQLALNYIFSDCKLLLTASLPSVQLTFLTKGHLLTSTPRFLGCVEPRARRDGTASEYSAAQGHRPGLCEGEKRPLTLACRANLPGRGGEQGQGV